MRSPLRILVLLCSTALLLSVACGTVGDPVPPNDPGGGARTAAAQTIEVVITKLGPQTPVAQPEGTATRPPSAPTIALPTAIASQTATTAPASPLPAGTATPVARCLHLQLVKDVTVQDGTQLGPKVVFTKTWRVKNVGTCTWTQAFSLVYVSGDKMSGPSSQTLEGKVEPGQTVDISLRLTAPAEEGKYTGLWKLRSEDGALFGAGPSADQPLTVTIKVARPDKLVYSFIDHYCQADWSNAQASLPCPGSIGSSDGFVVVVDDPVFEGGRKENEPGLWTNPQAIDKGRIRGVYPAMEVKSGDTFLAVLGCLDGSDQCDVDMRLLYQIGSGSVQTLDEWRVKASDGVKSVQVDLTDLVGKKVKFILAVRTRGDYQDDAAVWLVPRIMR